jgi:hypothetical protein
MMRVRNWTPALLAVIASVSLAASRPASPQGSDTATVYATVTDKGGKPLKGLTAAQFSVEENGNARKVLTVEPATGPISVALLVDRFGQDSTFNILAVRGAAQTIAKTLHLNPDTEISVTTIDLAAVPQVPFTQNAAEIANFIKHMPPGVDQSVLLDGIIAGSRAMANAKFPRRAIVALVAGYKVEVNSVDWPLLADTLRRSRASLWILEGRSSFGNGAPNSGRDAMMTKVVPSSGGAKFSVSVGTALETQAKKLAELLLAQYAVTYAAPSGTTSKLAVTVDVKDAKVLAPVWIAR